VDQAISTLARNRPIEAAILRAKALVADGSADAALETLDRLLADAPPGFAAWTLPIEPFLSQLKAHQGFAATLRRLAERAA
jgi:hypothetical protein